ncbi:sulfite exporter TauE/SafE family protein [Pseudidiomarina aestuarii]|uniref:Sulfite exporter TauE/SafE family protein n=1 Tax=Pseudidiomarina aestuarii TaxID=624146 RepID=A0A6N4DGA7_9GAMM|nr:sulfite exporter TauE/SafE family protein [Pseudidiomarina aestuarii]
MTMLDSFAALLMGLAGAGHCIMMCGGIAGAFGQSVSTTTLLFYNLGRITSYCIAGALVGYAASVLTLLMPDALLVLRFVSGLLLILFGLYLAGWWLVLLRLERIGMPLWRRLQPFAQRIRQRQQLPAIFGAGMLWGWLPCGLVYSALSWAALSGSASQGAWMMLMFGFGTFPAMFAFGWFSKALQSILKSQGFRQAMGIIMILYGAWVIQIALRQISLFS